jgi:hypothetical protein
MIDFQSASTLSYRNSTEETAAKIDNKKVVNKSIELG